MHQAGYIESPLCGLISRTPHNGLSTNFRFLTLFIIHKFQQIVKNYFSLAHLTNSNMVKSANIVIDQLSVEGSII
jgi:hypothetical protein